MTTDPDRLTPTSARAAACPNAESLAAFIDGVVLSSGERGQIEQHLCECADCRAIVGDAGLLVTGHMADAARSGAARLTPAGVFATRRGIGLAMLAAAAAVVLAARIFGVGWPFHGEYRRGALQQLFVALAEQPTRPVEGRLAGGYPYAPMTPTVRGATPRGGTLPDGTELLPQVRIALAAVENETTAHPGPGAKAALGAAYLIDGDIGEAVDLLRTAVTEEGGAAEAWNDLAVAYLARGARTGATQDLNDALSACDHALALRPDMPEALFNRALALERLRPSEAVPAWEKALRLDGTPWRAEIEQRLRLARRTP